MIYIRKPGLSPWFNLAAEEFVVKHLDDEVLMLWENDWCVVAGKHQHAYAEINTDEVFRRGIPVIRRISGGGTVVHAPGNINYSLITDNRKSHFKIDFKAATEPIVSFLKQFNLTVEVTGISNLSVNNLKISGNAAHVFKNRSLHHGTLLFDADLHIISALINRPENPYESAAIPSKPAPMANIAALLNTKITLSDFKLQLQEYLINTLNINFIRDFTESEIKAISQLADEKYRQDRWNFGYAPDYTFRRTIHLSNANADVVMTVKKGIVTHFEARGNTLFDPLTGLLTGVPHVREVFAEKIFVSGYSALFSEADKNQLISQLF